MEKEILSLQDCYPDTEKDLYYSVFLDKSGIKKTRSVSTFSLEGTEPMHVRLLSSEHGRLRISMKDCSISELKEYRIIAAGVKMRSLYFLDMEPAEAPSDFYIDINVIKQELEYGKNKYFQLLLECIRDGQYHRYNLCAMPETNPNVPARRSPQQGVVTQICERGITIEDAETRQKLEYFLAVYAPLSNYILRASLCKRETYMEISQICNITSYKLRKNILRLKIEAELGDYKFREVLFRYRSKLAEDAAEYPFTIKKQITRGSHLLLDVFLDLDQVTLKSLYWDVDLVVEDRNGNTYLMPPVVYRKTKATSSFYTAAYRTDNGFFLYPYSTGTTRLAFQYREENPYDKLTFPLKEAFALLLYKLFKPYWKKKQICLVYEKYCAMAQDNGYYFFKYCMDHPEITSGKNEIYYVITKDSPDRSRLAEYEKNLVDFTSLRHMIYLLTTDIMVSTDAKSHAYVFRCRTSLLRKYIKSKKLVFLQHGVTALKQVDFFYGKGKGGECDLFIVTSDFEKSIVEQNFGYTENEIANTGFARWDVLVDKSQGTRDVLVMPSWRNWLDEASDEDFRNSDYFHYYMDLLNSQRLQEILEKYDLKLNFYLHSKFREYIHDFSANSDRMRLIAFGEEPVNEMLMKCRLLVTDYSSVCWDVFYLGKPVLFYQFDLDKYEEAHGSYLDMRTDLFGERSEKCETLLNHLEEYAASDFQLKPEYAKMRSNYYKYMDNLNSKRIYDIMCKRLLK